MRPACRRRCVWSCPARARLESCAARVERVSARVVSPAPWLTEFGLDPPLRAHLLRATLADPEPQPVTDGATGALRIVLGNRSFASLLFGNGGD